MCEKSEMVCRCEEVTLSQIMEAIQAGDCSIDAIKKRTCAGMGFCQGRVCKRLVAQLLCVHRGIPIEKALESSERIPVGPISVTLIAETEGALEE